MIRRRKAEEEQRTFIAILLCITAYILWQSTWAPPPQPLELEAPTVSEAAPSASTVQEAAEPEPIPVSSLPARRVAFSTSELQSQLTSEGGGLTDILLPQYSAALDITPWWSHLFSAIGGESGSWEPVDPSTEPYRLLSDRGLLMAAGTLSDGVWSGHSLRHQVTGSDKVSVITPDGLRISKSFRPVEGKPHLLDVELRMQAAGGEAWSGKVWVGIMDALEGNVSRYANGISPQALVDEDFNQQLDFEDLQEETVYEDGPVGWFGLGDRYFLAAALPDNPRWGRLTYAHLGDALYSAMVMRPLELSPGGMETVHFQLYVGPKELDRLEEHGHQLEAAVDFGFFGFVSKPLLLGLRFFHSLLNNWGLAILALTVTLKALLFPLTHKSFTSNRAMQRIQPQMQALREQYKDEPQRLGQEQMKLFQQEGVNPMAGCLPMLVQMPIWFALYSVLLNASEVYQAPFWYLQDLSSQDPYGAFPLAAGILMFLQQRILPMSQTSDPTQQQMQKMMRWMPIVFCVFMFAFPAGLNLYILTNTSLSLLQMWWIHKQNPLHTPEAIGES